MSRPQKTRIVGSVKIFRAQGGEYPLHIVSGPRLGWIGKGLNGKLTFAPTYRMPSHNADNLRDIQLAIASVEADPNV